MTQKHQDDYTILRCKCTRRKSSFHDGVSRIVTPARRTFLKSGRRRLIPILISPVSFSHFLVERQKRIYRSWIRKNSGRL